MTRVTNNVPASLAIENGISIPLLFVDAIKVFDHDLDVCMDAHGHTLAQNTYV